MSWQRFTNLVAFVVVTSYPGLSVAQEIWSAREGSVTLKIPYDTLDDYGLSVAGNAWPTTPGDLVMTLELTLDEAVDLEFTVDADGSVRLLRRDLRVLEGITIGTSEAYQPVFDFIIAAGEELGPEGGDDLSGISPQVAALELRGTKAGFDHFRSTLSFASRDVVITRELAEALGVPKLAGVSLGRAEVSAVGQWIGGDGPATFDPFLPDGGDVGSLGSTGCDMTFCQLYGLAQFGRAGDIAGLSAATTSWNISPDTDCIWFDIPDEEHPFIVTNLFRLKTVDGSDRFEQIGMSHIKHGFFALSNHQCGGPACTHEPGHSGGAWLGTGCTDTYGASLNATQSGLGPRFEVNPWTGGWFFPGSHMDGGHSHDQIEHRLQVHDEDLEAAGNPGATYYGEGYYVMLDDVNVMNSASWKPATVSGSPGGTWSFSMSSSGTRPEDGFAIDAWLGATQTVLAEEVPPIEFVSPDGRCVLAAKATDLGGGTWHYEYALLNIDMDRQVGSFSIPISSGTSVSNVGFHAVEHHEEPFNTADGDAVAIDNAAWTDQVTSEAVTWSTTTNPLRWGMMYNFRFDADVEPASTSVTLGLFRTGEPSAVTGATTGPQAGGGPPIPALSDWGVILMGLVLLAGGAVVTARQRPSVSGGGRR